VPAGILTLPGIFDGGADSFGTFLESFEFLMKSAKSSSRPKTVSSNFAMFWIMNIKLLFPGQARNDKKVDFQSSL
jgi:hypothetical protein